MLLRRRVAAVASSAVLAVGLTACDTDMVGSAAVVGNDRISVTELQDHAREVLDVQGVDPAGDQRNLQMTLLNRLIAFELRDRIAADAGITVTEADVDTFIAEQLIAQAPDGDLTPLLAQNAMTEDTLREAVREVLVLEQIGGQQAYFEAMAAASQEVGVEVNPRYGRWTGAGIEEVSGSISLRAGESAGATEQHPGQ